MPEGLGSASSRGQLHRSALNARRPDSIKITKAKSAITVSKNTQSSTIRLEEDPELPPSQFIAGAVVLVIKLFRITSD